MIPSLIRFVKQMIGWRRAKRCLAGKHKWEDVKHPTRSRITITRCKYCGNGFMT